METARSRATLKLVTCGLPQLYKVKKTATEKNAAQTLQNTSKRVRGVAQLVEALLYKPEGRGFDSRWSHWDSSVT
jgi:hypothetical protein